MDWLDRLAQVAGCAVLAGVAACGRTGVLASLPALAPTARLDVCAAAVDRSHRIVVAIADPADSATTAEARVAVASLVLVQVTTALGPTPCGERSMTLVVRTGAEMDSALDVRQVTDRDARDALDQGIDVLVTRDVAVTAYAASRGDLTSVPLSWDRTYLLLVPDPASITAVAPSDSSGTGLRSALASDAVPAESRPFTSTRWWTQSATCVSDTARMPKAESGSPLVSAPAAQRIIYPRGDSVARALAERLVVLAATGNRSLAVLAPRFDPTRTEMSVVGLPAEQFARALSDGTAGGFVVAIPSRTSTTCRDQHRLNDTIPWLALGTDSRGGEVVPLIETRARAIVRRDAVARISVVGDSASLAQSRVRGP
jgi:hypothetical protein